MDEMKTMEGILFRDILQNFDPEHDKWVMERKRKREEEEKRERYKKAVPARYWAESLDTYKADSDERKAAKSKACAFIHAVKCGQFQTIIFLGTVGTGKTHLACGIIRECGGIYRLAPAIVEEIRRAKSFTAKETEAEILEDYGRASLLVVDEIGRGVAAAEEQYMLYQIINERYNRRKPTVLISNQTKKDFLQYVGISAADRLTESAQAVEFAGKSYRVSLRSSG